MSDRVCHEATGSWSKFSLCSGIVFRRLSDIWAAISGFGTLSTIVSVLNRRPCLKYSNHGTNTDVHLAGDSLD
jgi:hypothetical protein